MNRQLVVVGIDPGMSGGFAALGGDCAQACAFSTMADFMAWLVALTSGIKLKAYVEEPPVFFKGAGGGLASQAKLHRNLGQYEGILMGLDVAFETVRPQRWQAGLPGLAKLAGKDRKKALHNLAAQRYPQLKPTLKTCDAILIAEYGIKQER